MEMKKEKKREYMKEYDKDRYRPAYYEEMRAEKIFCNCGCLIRRSNMRLHVKTTKHEETLKKQTDDSKLNIKKLNEKLEKEIKENMMKRKIKKN